MAANPFMVLGLVPHCSQVECAHCANAVKQSFRKLALRHHPDKGGQKERFQAINNAYELLQEPSKRAQHARTVLGQSGSSARRVASPTSSGSKSHADKTYRDWP